MRPPQSHNIWDDVVTSKSHKYQLSNEYTHIYGFLVGLRLIYILLDPTLKVRNENSKFPGKWNFDNTLVYVWRWSGKVLVYAYTSLESIWFWVGPLVVETLECRRSFDLVRTITALKYLNRYTVNLRIAAI